MALAMFWGAELSEAFFGARMPWKAVPRIPRSPVLRGVAGVLVALAAVAAVLGQPTVDDRWDRIEPDAGRRIAERDIYVDPAEVLDLRRDLAVRVTILDLRSEADFNRFHVAGSRRIPADRTRDPAVVKSLPSGDDTVLILASNGEAEATRAWRDLASQGVLNLYVLEGGINAWLDRYPPSPCMATRDPAFPGGDVAAWRFAVSVGDRIPSAHPELERREIVRECDDTGSTIAEGHAAGLPYIKKVRLQRKAAAKGGCG
jgi:rhodanese-related sulfurtransferase